MEIKLVFFHFRSFSMESDESFLTFFRVLHNYILSNIPFKTCHVVDDHVIRLKHPQIIPVMYDFQYHIGARSRLN